MDIAHVRVDNRLVHGQILEAWIPYMQASCLVVVDDYVASDYFCESVIRMAIPREVEVIICGLHEFADTYSFHQGSGKKTIVLFSKISDALTAYRLGFRFDSLNIGNVHTEECKIHCTASVRLSDSDVRDLSSLRAERVRIVLQPVPREKPIDYFDVIRLHKS